MSPDRPKGPPSSTERPIRGARGTSDEPSTGGRTPKRSADEPNIRRRLSTVPVNLEINDRRMPIGPVVMIVLARRVCAATLRSNLVPHLPSSPSPSSCWPAGTATAHPGRAQPRSSSPHWCSWPRRIDSLCSREFRCTYPGSRAIQERRGRASSQPRLPGLLCRPLTAPGPRLAVRRLRRRSGPSPPPTAAGPPRSSARRRPRRAIGRLATQAYMAGTG